MSIFSTGRWCLKSDWGPGAGGRWPVRSGVDGAWLSDNPISTPDFLQLIHDPDTFRRFLESAREIYRGETFLRSVATQVLSGAVAASEAQRQALDDAFHKGRRGKLSRELL